MPRPSYQNIALAKVPGTYERAKAMFVVDHVLDSEYDVSLDVKNLMCEKFMPKYKC